MSGIEYYAKSYELEWLQEQIYDLQNKIRELQMENELLRNDLNTIKMEGCWQFVEDPNHTHRRKNE
jgi:predicted RNase H-like nuclease (RuvC/YqgF family)